MFSYRRVDVYACSLRTLDRCLEEDDNLESIRYWKCSLYYTNSINLLKVKIEQSYIIQILFSLFISKCYLRILAHETNTKSLINSSTWKLPFIPQTSAMVSFLFFSISVHDQRHKILKAASESPFQSKLDWFVCAKRISFSLYGTGYSSRQKILLH